MENRRAMVVALRSGGKAFLFEPDPWASRRSLDASIRTLRRIILADDATTRERSEAASQSNMDLRPPIA